MKQTNPGYFSMTEEAFLLHSLKEVVNIWSSGSGQASFNFSVEDGLASLQLGFQLGRPGDPHFSPQDSDHVQPQPQPDDLPQEQAGWQQQRRRRRRFKGPAQRTRDRARAAAHQASNQSSTAAVTAVPVVMLPFAGKLLPVKPTKEKVTEPVTPSQSQPLQVSGRPIKATNVPVPGTSSEDFNSAKKALFPPAQEPVYPSNSRTFPPSTKSPPKPPYTHPPSKPPTTYREKEDDLWTRLFTT